MVLHSERCEINKSFETISTIIAKIELKLIMANFRNEHFTKEPKIHV